LRRQVEFVFLGVFRDFGVDERDLGLGDRDGADVLFPEARFEAACG